MFVLPLLVLTKEADPYYGRLYSKIILVLIQDQKFELFIKVNISNHFNCYL